MKECFIILVGLIIISILISFQGCNDVSDGDITPININPAYPRLSMWWPDSWDQEPRELARYDYIGWGNWEDENTLTLLKQLNPDQLHFTAISITETCWGFWEYDSALVSQIPDLWFLTQVGSTLVTDVDENQTIIEVAETRDRNGIPLFEAGDILACGFESMRLLAVIHNQRTLTLERGFVREAASHSTGDRIAAHIEFWPETWVMNLSTLCPTVDVGNGPESWVDWALRNYIPYYWPNQRDGFLIDRIEDSQSWLVYEKAYGRTIDPDCSNRLVEDGYQTFDAAWQEGIRGFLPGIREMLQGKPLFGNTFGAYNDLLNGSIWESCPGNWSDTVPEVFTDWAQRVLRADGYIEVSKKGYSPNFSTVETYELEEYLPDPGVNNPLLDPNFEPDYQRMRFGITTALLGDGYFSYEINTNGHGTLGLMWFDEYDNVGEGRGYLGYPEGDAYVIIDLGDAGQVFRRDYDNGIVVCNPSGSQVIINLGGIYRLIRGTQVTYINTGENVSVITLLSQDGRILLKID